MLIYIPLYVAQVLNLKSVPFVLLLHISFIGLLRNSCMVNKIINKYICHMGHFASKFGEMCNIFSVCTCD